MEQETLLVTNRKSVESKFSKLIVCLTNIIRISSSCKVVIGYPGLPNVNRDMNLSDAVLFETPKDGVIEVRLIELKSNEGSFLLSKIAASSGLSFGVKSDDPNNRAFSHDEIERIASSIELLKTNLKSNKLFAPEQIDFISRKFDEIQDASNRLGRKDWITYVAGTLTSICVSAGFTPEIRRELLSYTNTAFGWIFENVLTLLS